MPKTSSILSDDRWRPVFGELLETVAERQHITVEEIGRQLDRISGSTGRRRKSDWWRYVNEGRIPTPGQLSQLSVVLKIPKAVLQICAGYIDEILVSCYTVAESNRPPATWPFAISPRRAAFAVLFALFPTESMHIGRRASIFQFMAGSIIRLNLSEEEGFLTGKNWNAAWLYPYPVTLEHLSEHVYGSNAIAISPIRKPHKQAEPRKKPTMKLAPGKIHGPFILQISDSKGTPQRSYCSVTAEAQVDVASSIAKHISTVQPVRITSKSIMTEVVHVLHARPLSLLTRIDHASEYIHLWADQLDKPLARAVRLSVHPWNQRTLTPDWVRWLKGTIKQRPAHMWA